MGGSASDAGTRNPARRGERGLPLGAVRYADRFHLLALRRLFCARQSALHRPALSAVGGDRRCDRVWRDRPGDRPELHARLDVRLCVGAVAGRDLDRLHPAARAAAGACAVHHPVVPRADRECAAVGDGDALHPALLDPVLHQRFPRRAGAADRLAAALARGAVVVAASSSAPTRSWRASTRAMRTRCAGPKAPTAPRTASSPTSTTNSARRSTPSSASPS